MKFRYWAIIYIVISLLCFDPKPFLGGDNAVYIILAESLCKYGEMRDLQYPDEPLHTQYPHGLQLLLAPIVAVFGRNILIMKLLILSTGAVGFFFYRKITQSILPPFYATLCTLMFLAVPVLVEYSHYVLSEAPYLMFSLGSIWFMIKGEKR